MMLTQESRDILEKSPWSQIHLLLHLYEEICLSSSRKLNYSYWAPGKENKIISKFLPKCTVHFWGKIYAKITVPQMKTRTKFCHLFPCRLNSLGQKIKGCGINPTGIYFSYIRLIVWNTSFHPSLIYFPSFLSSPFFHKCPLCASHCAYVTKAR